MLDTFKIVGMVTIVVTDAFGVTKTVEKKNLVVDSGLNLICSRLKDNTDAAIGYMAVGTDTTAAASAQTALLAEIARVAVSTTVTANSVEFEATFGAGTGTGALTEAGLFNDASAGTMLSRLVFPVVNKEASDSMTITWTITVNVA